MKFLYSFLFFIFTLSLNAQINFTIYDDVPGNIKNYKPTYNEQYPGWGKMLYQEYIQFNDINEGFEKWLKAGGNQFKPLVRYYKNWRKNILPWVQTNGEITLPDLKTYQKNLNVAQLSAQNELKRSPQNWTFLGPKETFWLNESGSSETPLSCPWQVNIYSFDVAQTDVHTIYVGTETGYVNKSTDNGMHWHLLGTNYNFGGGVTAVAIHPENANVVYVSAGSQIHKTEDGGTTWMPLLPLNNLFQSDRIAIDDTDPNRIFAASHQGVFLSNDAGQNWQKSWNSRAYDVHINPANSQLVYALVQRLQGFSLVLSDDGGQTFNFDPTFPPNINDESGGLIAVTPANPNVIIALMLTPNNTPVLYKKDIQQNVWSLLATGQSTAYPMNNGQGYFDLALEISPNDEQIIYAGASTLYKSFNGGTNFTIVGGYGGAFAIHPDIQDMKILKNGDVWVSTDGGLTISEDNFTNTDSYFARNNGIVGSDMWGFDQGWNEDLIVGGRYHNGNTAIADFYQPKALRMGGAESPTGWVLKGKNRHVAFDDLGAGWILPKIAEGQPEGRFIFSKYPNMDEYGGRRGNVIYHPNYYGQIYLGEGNAFWKSEDGGSSFEMIHDFGNRVRYIDMSYSNPLVMYADVVNEGFFKTEDGGMNWVHKPALTNGQNGGSNWEGNTFFAISPSNENVVYACYLNGTWSSILGRIYKSEDGGNSWASWTNNLSEVTKSLVIQPDENGDDIVYLFTLGRSGKSAKVFWKGQNGDQWEVFGDGYPAGFSVNHALPFFRDGKIRVAGNAGIWEADLLQQNFQPLIQPWIEKQEYSCILDTLYFEDHSILNHNGAEWTWAIEPSPIFIDDPKSRNPKVVLGEPGEYTVQVTVSQNGKTYSKTIANMVRGLECPSFENCNNPALLTKTNWNLEFVDSEEVNFPGTAVMAFDGNPETIWHTRWSTGSDPYPHEIQVGLEEPTFVHEFTYLPRQVGENGRIKDYELYISEDKDDWGEAVHTGAFENSLSPQTINFPKPIPGQYFKLVALSEVNGNAWTSVAEIDIVGCRLISTSTVDQKKHQHLKSFPVPTMGAVEISLPSSSSFQYAITNVNGVVLDHGSINYPEKTYSFRFDNYPAGFYVIKLIDQEDRVFYTKVIKE